MGKTKFDIKEIDRYISTETLTVSAKAKFGYNDDYFLSETFSVDKELSQADVRKIRIYKHFLLQKDLVKILFLEKRIKKEVYEEKVKEIEKLLKMFEG